VCQLGWSTKRRRVWYGRRSVRTVADRNPVGQHGHTSGQYRDTAGKYCNAAGEHCHPLGKHHQSIRPGFNVSELDVSRLDIDRFFISNDDPRQHHSTLNDSTDNDESDNDESKQSGSFPERPLQHHLRHCQQHDGRHYRNGRKLELFGNNAGFALSIHRRNGWNWNVGVNLRNGWSLRSGWNRASLPASGHTAFEIIQGKSFG